MVYRSALWTALSNHITLCMITRLSLAWIWAWHNALLYTIYKLCSNDLILYIFDRLWKAGLLCKEGRKYPAVYKFPWLLSWNQRCSPKLWTVLVWLSDIFKKVSSSFDGIKRALGEMSLGETIKALLSQSPPASFWILDAFKRLAFIIFNGKVKIWAMLI